MNHKKLFDDGQEFDAEADYVFIVKKQRAAFLISQLMDLNIVVKEFTSIFIIYHVYLGALNPTETMLVIYFSDDTLDKMAEILEVKVRLLDHGSTMPFKNHAEELYEQFQARQKQFLMMKVFEQEIDID